MNYSLLSECCTGFRLYVAFYKYTTNLNEIVSRIWDIADKMGMTKLDGPLYTLHALPNNLTILPPHCTHRDYILGLVLQCEKIPLTFF